MDECGQKWMFADAHRLDHHFLVGIVAPVRHSWGVTDYTEVDHTEVSYAA